MSRKAVLVQRRIPALAVRYIPLGQSPPVILLLRPHGTASPRLQPHIPHLDLCHLCRARLPRSLFLVTALGSRHGGDGGAAGASRVLPRSDVYACAVEAGVRV